MVGIVETISQWHSEVLEIFAVLRNPDIMSTTGISSHVPVLRTLHGRDVIDRGMQFIRTEM